MTARRLMLVHAHPDDETIGTGATMARYAAEGVQVTLVTCTRGERGEILVPELAHLAEGDGGGLGEHREGELAAACAALGCTDHRFLGGAGRWRDSGMMGTDPNADPASFWQASLELPVAELVALLRDVRPQVVVTYDERGGYGHPDHIQAHRVTTAACRKAAEPGFRPDLGAPWQVAKIYHTAMPRSALQQGLDALRAAGHAGFLEVDSVDDLPFGIDDALVTTEIDAGAHLAAKVAAMRAHRTQIAVDGPFFALADQVGQPVLGTEYYVLAGGTAHPDADGRERDLFAGLP